MKRIVLLFFAFHFSLFTLHAQSWVWAREGTQEDNDWQSVAGDDKGNSYSTGGYYLSMNFGGGHFVNCSSLSNAFLVKYDSSGNLIWLTQPTPVTANDNSYGFAVASNSKGNAYVTGYISGNVTFGTDTLISPNIDMFIAKYDAFGNVLWAKQGSVANNHNTGWGEAVTVDAADNVYVTGAFGGTITLGAFSLTNLTNNYDAFLVKYDANGNVVWARQANLGVANSSCYGESLAVDASGEVFVAGYFHDTVSFGAISLKSISAAGDAFLAKYDSNGNLLWVKQSVSFTHTSSCWAWSMVVDAFGASYITGYISDTVNFYTKVLKGKYGVPSPEGNGDLFLAKYDPNGQLVWVRQSYDDSINWKGYSLAIDAYNRIYLSAGGFPVNYRPVIGQERIVFCDDTLKINNATDPSLVLKIDTAGNAVCGSILRTCADDQNSIACSRNGKYVYFQGNIADSITFNHNFLNPPQPGYFFVARWQPCISKCTIPGIALTTKPVIICRAGDSGSVLAYPLGGMSPYTYSWSNGKTTQFISGLSAGNYQVTITDTNGCSISTIAIINTTNYPLIVPCCATTITIGQSAPITVTPASRYLWYPSTGLSCDTCQSPIASPTVTTWYYVTVTDSFGCTATDSVLITVNNPEKCGTVFVPDVFSPNKDGQNDILYVRGNCINTMDFVIYDRWGNRVFESENQSIGWDGTYKNQAMNAGTYMYYLKGSMQDGTPIDKKGNVTLVR